MRQDETIWIAEPFTNHLLAKGWFCQNITPGFIYQDGKKFSPMSGLPDLLIGKKGFISRWVEFKVLKPGRTISFTEAQIEMFPKMHYAGIPIYILVAQEPLMGKQLKLEELYRKLMGEPNCHYMLAGKEFYKYLT